MWFMIVCMLMMKWKEDRLGRLFKVVGAYNLGLGLFEGF